MENLNEMLVKIQDEMAIFNSEATKRAEKGNMASGARSRKSSLAIASMFKEWRKASVQKD